MDGQTLDTTIEIVNGERVRVESFKYEVGGQEREQSRRLAMPAEAPSPREIEHDAIAREHGAACAGFAAELASEIGCGVSRARDLLIATGDADYQRALREHVEALRTAVKARRAARAAGAERAELLATKNRYGSLVNNTKLALEREEDILRKAPKFSRRPPGLDPHRRKLEELRATLAKQEAELQTARAALAKYDAKQGA